MKISATVHNVLSMNVAIFDLSRLIDNDTLERDILSNQDKKFDYNPDNTLYEDSHIPNSSALRQLLKIIDQSVETIVPGINNCIEKESDGIAGSAPLNNFWGHIMRPNQSTFIHNHGASSLEGDGIKTNAVISWCYYVKVPENGGNLMFPMYLHPHAQYDFELIPSTSKLIVFPGWMNHITKINASNENRISISGNYYLQSYMQTFDIASPELQLQVTDFIGAPSLNINRKLVAM